MNKNSRDKKPISRPPDQSPISILDGNHFMVSASDGDLKDESHGIFKDDTRFLSRFHMQINGKDPVTLTAMKTTHYSSAHYLTNSDISEGAVQIENQSLAIERKRFIENDVREELSITNVTEGAFSFSLTFLLDSDYADLFQVKSRVFYGSDRGFETGQLRISRKFLSSHDNAFQFSCLDPKTVFRARTLVWFSKRGYVRKNSITFRIALKPKEEFHLTIVVVLLARGEGRQSSYASRDFDLEEARIERSLAKWQHEHPKLATNWDSLSHTFRASLSGLASLTMSDPTGRQNWLLPAAGCPWFMTVFGRDTIITSYQSLLFTNRLASGAVEALASYQAAKVDPQKDAEPGKILHELRFGDYAIASERFPYYGSIDSTPLFLILVSELYRWSNNRSFAQKYRKNIMSALRWIDEFGDTDGDGFVEYKKKSKGGLVNQCWKDSSNSILFSSGELAEAPIATCEVQGYVFDAKRRIAEIARDVWRDKSLARKLDLEARELKHLFNEKFWIGEKGYYALALDGKKRKVDSMTSNNGQLFWSGIVDPKHARSVANRLMSPDMFSGYGLRTMSISDAGYNPISYHDGCVWAHDNSLIAKGLVDYGFEREAGQVIRAIFDASPHFQYTMPEAFAGFARMKTGFPVRYPTACSPQAWASGASLLMLRTLLGISPSTNSKKRIQLRPLESGKPLSLELAGLHAFGKIFDVSVEDGRARVSEGGKDKVARN